MKFMTITFVFMNLVMSAMNSNKANVHNQSRKNHPGTYENNLNKSGLITNNEQEPLFRYQTENRVYYYPLQPQENVSADNIIVPLEKIEVPGLKKAKDDKLMDLLATTLKDGKFKQEGYIQDLLILLSKSLYVADLNNSEHQKILKELGDVLAEGHPKQAWYYKLLTLLGIAIKHGKFLEDDRHETLKIVGKIVETESFEPDEAAEILIAMLVHNLRPNIHHYKRLGLDPVKFEKEFLEKIEPQSKTKIQKKCKKCKLCKKHKK